MTFTYDTNTAIGRVRLDIGDTVESRKYLHDEEIQIALNAHPNEKRAAIKCVHLILAHIAKEVDRNAQGMNTTRSQATSHYRDLLRDLQREAASGSSSAPYAGMADKAETDASTDADEMTNRARIGMDDYVSDPSGSLC